MRVGYLMRRLGVFLLIIWMAASINFFIPRLSPANPIRERLLQAISQGGAQVGTMEDVVKSYEARFGLDQPLWLQYIRYLSDLARLDFGVSITRFPTPVTELIMTALPWSLGLVTVATLLAFVFGTLFGALLAWPRSPAVFQVLVPPLLTLSAVPYYLLGLILIYIFAFSLKLLPLGGGYPIGFSPSLDPAFVLEVLRHAILPAFSVVLAGLGFWALSMRAMMISIQGEDYVTLAEAKGLRTSNIFFNYAARNAILPQTTALAISLGHVVSGAVLVEVVFGYPGIGSLLYQSIRQFDYTVIYGIVFLVIVAIGLATLILDLLLPTIDPRITYQQS